MFASPFGIGLPPNGMAYLPPILARRQNHLSTKFGEMRQHTHAEDGRVQPMFGAFNLLFSFVLLFQDCCPPLHNSVKT